MALYTITLHAPDGTLLADLSNIWTSLHYVLERNREGSIDLTLNLLAAEDLATELGYRNQFYGLFASGMNELRVARGSRSMIGGQLLEAIPNLERTGGTLDMQAEGHLGLFKDRQLWPNDVLSYDAIDIGQLAWSRIAATQARDDGDFGITQGEIQPSRTIVEKQRYLGQSIRDLLVSYTELSDSGDMEFTPDKQFNWHSPGLGQDQFDLPFRWDSNIAKISGSRSARQLVNVAIVRGNGNDAIDPQVRTDYVSRAAFHRRERVFDYSSVPNVDYLQSQGDEKLRTNAYPAVLPAMTLDATKEPFLGAYSLGDRVPIQISGRPSFAHLDEQLVRLNLLDVSVDPHTQHESIQVEASIA